MGNTQGTEKEFLEGVEAGNYRRGGASGLNMYASGKLSEAENPLYSREEAAKLRALGIEQRMKVKISDHYNRLVVGDGNVPPSHALSNLVTARGEEVGDLSGEVDPSSQLSYSPLPGLLHKYELALLYTSLTCSAHCRYCYRLDLFSGKSGKSLAKVEPVVDYIRTHNRRVAAEGGLHPESGRPPLKEVLLSGGDPMVLNNRKLAQWFAALAEAGISRIRVGTKELAFFPQRFDRDFFNMLDRFHAFYPDVRLVFPVHFTHPDEFLERDENADYLPLRHEETNRWMPAVDMAVRNLARRRTFIAMENQTPIIRGVNDDSDMLRLLQRELYHHGIGNHYFFQCRMIEGHRSFAIPVEETLALFEKSQRGLSGVESHARLVMSTKLGKLEVVGKAGERGAETVIFRLLRAPGDAVKRGKLAMARANPEALWVDDYFDRFVFDEIGFVEESCLENN